MKGANDFQRTDPPAVLLPDPSGASGILTQDDPASLEVRIYVLTHKDFTPPPLSEYIPLSVHEAAGENIAAKNDTFSELTGLYWIWKNDTASEIVGTAHYRRYLLNADGALLTAAEITGILQSHDCITTKELQLNFPYYEGFGKNHKFYYLDELRKVLSEKCPSGLSLYDALVHKPHTYFGNMLIAKKALYDDYCAWLFDILFTLEKRIVIDEPDSYHRRIFGFISEFLWYFYVKKEGLSAFETMVGMTREKAETTEIKDQLAAYFAAGDHEGAKRFFLDARAKRPDILMEASDITGELHLCMEVIAICEYEAAAGKPTLLARISGFPELMAFCSRLNAYVIGESHGELSPALTEWVRLAKPDGEAIFVARAMFGILC